MRIAFVHDWAPDVGQVMTWRDGLWAALVELIKRGNDVRYFSLADNHIRFDNGGLPSSLVPEGVLKTDVAAFAPDVILHWADLTRPNAFIGRDLGCKQALCFAGGSTSGGTIDAFDHVFVESKSYLDAFTAMGRSVSVAFGTNTNLFDPELDALVRQKKTIDVLFPATFCEWKRHKLLAKAVTDTKWRTVMCGYMYDAHEMDCWREPQYRGATVLPHVSAEVLAHLYKSASVVAIPSRADGGSQRTVLEALAMNVPVVVCSDSDKTTEYVRESAGVIVLPEEQALRDGIRKAMRLSTNTRDYIMGKWSHRHYADALEAGLLAL